MTNMTNRNIGRVITISSKWIVAELYPNIGNYVNTVDGIRFVGEIGSYVSIEETDRKVIAEIISIDEKNSVGSEIMNKPNSNRMVNLNLIGEISGGAFVFGVSKMPFIFSEISIITEIDLRTMLEIGNEEIVIDADKQLTRAVSLTIGSSVIFPDYDVKINIDKFFGFHFAVFGNTGAGKSNTVARIIQNVFKKKSNSAVGAKFIIIDSNGEYESSICELNTINPDIRVNCLTADSECTEGNCLELPVWALSADDWAVLLHASEKTQIPIIKRAIDIARIFYDPENTDNILKNHIVASTIIGILNSSESSPSSSDKIKTIITTFGTDEIKLDRNIEATGKKVRSLLNVSYGQFTDIEGLQVFCEDFLLNDVNERITRSNNVVYDIVQFKNAVDFAILYEGSISSPRIQEYTATLSTRLQALIDSDQGRILTKTSFSRIDDYVESILGTNQIVNIDISSLDDSSSEVVVKVITKLFFDHLKKMNKKADMPVNLIMEHKFDRLEMLIGRSGIGKLTESNVIIFGVGGVGSYVAESFARSAIGNITLVDFDEISESNLNRQIHATISTVGEVKVEVMKKRILSINPECNVTIRKELLNENVKDFFIDKNYDFVVDAIDMIKSKVELIKYCNNNNINLISSMGFGNKMNPEMITITDISKTTMCPLAKKMRKLLKAENIEKLVVAYSNEESLKPDKSDNYKTESLTEYRDSNVLPKKTTPGSNVFVPGTAGLIISSYVIRKLLEEM